MPDAALTRQDEVTEVLRSLRESLREPPFASTLVLLVSSKGQAEERGTVGCSQSEAGATNGRAVSGRNTSSAVQRQCAALVAVIERCLTAPGERGC